MNKLNTVHCFGEELVLFINVHETQTRGRISGGKNRNALKAGDFTVRHSEPEFS